MPAEIPGQRPVELQIHRDSAPLLVALDSDNHPRGAYAQNSCKKLAVSSILPYEKRIRGEIPHKLWKNQNS